MTQVDSPTPVASTSREPKSRFGWLAPVMVVVLVDRLTKTLALHMAGSGRSTMVPRLLDLVIFRNPGASRGLLANHPIVLVLLEMLAVAITVYLAHRFRGGLGGFGFAMIAGGGIGNLADRFIYAGFTPTFHLGQVVDWISWHGSRTVFNLSDVAIQLGLVLIGISIVANAMRGRYHKRRAKGISIRSSTSASPGVSA